MEYIITVTVYFSKASNFQQNALALPFLTACHLYLINDGKIKKKQQNVVFSKTVLPMFILF